MRCEEIMKRNLECLAPDDTAATAAKRMRDANVGFLPICDAGLRVLGVVTDRDLAIRVLAEDRAGDTTLGRCMSEEVVSCSPSDDLRTAEQRMAKHRKSRILCIDESGTLMGIISLSDIAQHEEGTRAAKTLRRVSEREVRPSL